MDWKKYLLPFLYYIVCPFALLSYFIEPFTDNVRIYFGVAKITDFCGQFPSNLDTCWEIKPIGNRLLFYVLNKLTPFQTEWMYETWIKIIVAIITIIIIWYTSKQISKKWNIPFDYPFLISFISIFMVNDYILLDVEWFTIVICYLSIGLWLSDNILLNCLSGFLAFSLLLMKGVTILMIPMILIIIYLIDNENLERKTMHFIAGSLIGSTLLLYLWTFFTPHVFSDMILSAELAHVTSMGIILRMGNLFALTFFMLYFIPAICAGCLALVFLYVFYSKSHLKNIILLMMSWIIPLVAIAIQGEFFMYHFTLLLIPTIFTILYFIKINPDKYQWLAIFTIFMIITTMVFSAGWSVSKNGFTYSYWNIRESVASEIQNKFQFDNEPYVLYMDEGSAPYYFKAKSYCRYVCPLPIQRHALQWDLSNVPEYQDIENCILSYDGKYIIATDWWVNWTEPRREIITTKIQTEYHKVWSKEWEVYERN